jgi:CRP-like cAMP-binding protein
MTTKYDTTKEALMKCADLAGLDDCSLAELIWRGEEQTLNQGQVVYVSGAKLDHTFGLVVSGDLVVEKAGKILGGIAEDQIFGEMAYFTNKRVRTATVRVGSPQAIILKFRLTAAELADPRLSGLRKRLSMHTWTKFVSTCQRPRECDGLY